MEEPVMRKMCEAEKHSWTIDVANGLGEMIFRQCDVCLLIDYKPEHKPQPTEDENE